MPLKTARLTILVTPSTKEAFEAQCRSEDATPSQVVRRLIREYMEQQPARAAAPVAKSALARGAT
jgi:hypothetical protein